MTALPEPQTQTPQMAVEYVTPMMAQQYLTHNTHNRSLSSGQVNKYAYAMQLGDWQLSDSIKFDTYGRLIDGQHRLAAVVQSNCTVQMFVVRGLNPSAQDIIDTGRARRASDAVKLRGHKNYVILSSGARLAIAYENKWITKLGSANYPRVITTPEILRFIENNPSLLSAAKTADVDRHHINIQPSVLCFARFVLGGVDQLAAHTFFRDLSDMKTTGIGDPRAALLKRLSVRDSTDLIHDVIYMVFRTWNAIRTGESLRLLKVPKGDVVIPEPI